MAQAGTHTRGATWPSWFSSGRTTLNQEEANLRFEARELKPYAEPVSADELAQGEVYFSVRYIDEQMLIPTMDTLVFVGKDLDPGDSGRLYFQDIDSYLQGVRFATASEGDGALFITESVDKPWVFQFDQALDLLLKCSIRRRSGHGSASSRRPR
jgi:hypothetical protein